jgi:pilus assembly protein Flp/PilA
MSVNQPRELSFDAEEGGRNSSSNYNLRSKQMIKKFFRDETGLELSEYAVAAALVAIAVVGAFTALGTAISGKITSLGSTISK